MKPALAINGLLVERSRQFALRIESLTLEPGKIIGIAGPNGSGKTTLLEAVVSLLKTDAGKILLEGKVLAGNLRYLKSKLGYIPDDEDWLIPELTAGEYFKLLASIYKSAGRPVSAERISQLAKQLSFNSFDQRLDTLSHGNKKKVQIIAGIMHEPAVIIIDELRNGLDPIAILAAEKVIKAEAKRGAAVCASSHDLWWVERVTDEILLIHDGRVLLKAPTKQLVRKYGSLEKLFIGMVDGKIRLPKT